MNNSKLKVIIGDIIKAASEYDAIAHGANCFNIQNGGIALKIKKAFPQVYDADLVTTAGDIDKLGNYTFAKQIWPDGLKRKQTIIFNLYSQYSYNTLVKPLDYEALTLALRKYAAKARKNNWKVALPIIGYGLAGGDLNHIITIMYFEMLDVETDIIVFEGAKKPIHTKVKIDSIINKIENNYKTNIAIDRQAKLLNLS